MKRSILTVMLIALLTISITACNNSDTKNNAPVTQTDTSGMHHIMETGEVYTCIMDSDVIGDKPGLCPKCGMTLVKRKITDSQRKMLKERTYTKPNYK